MAISKAEHSVQQCESPACSRRRKSWRAWLDPVRGYSLDGHWYCSSPCFEQALAFAVGQLLPGTPQSPPPAHRIPLGLLLLSRGYVDNEQLQRALKAQKDSGSGRVGEWLRHMGAVTEEQVTQMLGLQWSIPVFPFSQSRHYLECAHLVPLPLLEAAEMVPVHHIPTSRTLYIAFIDRVNYSALYAVEKILGCHTEPCLALQSHLVRALEELRGRPRSTEIVVDSNSDSWDIAGVISNHAERLDGAEVRMSGFNGFIWARVLSPSAYTDILVQTRRNQPELFLPAEPQE